MRTRTIGSPIGQTIPTLQNPRCQWVFASEPNDNASTASTGYAEAGRTCEMIPYYAATPELSRDVWAVPTSSGPQTPMVSKPPVTDFPSYWLVVPGKFCRQYLTSS